MVYLNLIGFLGGPEFSRRLAISFTLHFLILFAFGLGGIFLAPPKIPLIQSYQVNLVALPSKNYPKAPLAKRQVLPKTPISQLEKIPALPTPKAIPEPLARTKPQIKPKPKPEISIPSANQVDSRINEALSKLKSKSGEKESESIIGDNENTDSHDAKTIEGMGLSAADLEAHPDVSLFISQLRQKVRNEWIVPLSLRDKDLRLLSVALIRLHSDGDLLELTLLKSSGNHVYDQSVLRAVKRAAPFSDLPVIIRKDAKDRGFELGFPSQELQ